MSPLARLSAALLLTACSTPGKVAPTAGPSAGSTHVIEPAPMNLEAECSQAAGLALAGEHKPAVDHLASILRAGATCPNAVLERVDDSRRRVTDADDLVRRGIEARGAGDFAAASESFRLALTVYPKYYWVQKLQHDLENSTQEVIALRKEFAELVSAGRTSEALEMLHQVSVSPLTRPDIAREIERIRGEFAGARLREARQAQLAGDLPHAMRSIQDAIAAQPDEPVRRAVVDRARRLGLKMFSAGELVHAQTLWKAALSLDRTDELLHQYLDEVETRLQTLTEINEDDPG